jgi:porin
MTIGKLSGASHATMALRAAAMAALIAVPGASRADDGPPSVLDGIPELASAAAFKKQLADKGIGVQVNYIGEVLGNVAGGQQQGAVYDGRAELVIDADLEKLLGIQGGAFHTNGYWIQGTGLTRYFIGNIMTVSNIEALPTVRLYELWYEQKFFDGKLGLRFGQLAADTEFMLSKYSALFINSTFGWPDIYAVDLPSGGPAYPLATPGVRLKLGDDKDPFNVLMAVYNGDPAGPGLNDPQRRDPYGVNFTLQGPPLAIQEIQYRYNQGKDDKGLAGTVKLGAYEHFGNFPDLRFDINGLPIGITGAQAGELRGNWAIYGVWDQQIYRLPDDPAKGVAFFIRAAGTPQDRNLVDFYIDGGLNFIGLVPGRPDDVVGVAGAYARISNAVRGFQIDAAIFPVQDYEGLVEATYQAQLMPGWTLQPDFQYIIHPGGNIADGSGQPAKNAVVVGLRTTMAF